MAVYTQHGPKPFTWSYSKLKNFETCPKKHYEVDLAKSIKEGESDQLAWGNEVHDKLAKACGEKREPLPPSMKSYQSFVDRIVTGQGNILVENQMALTKEFGACGYFDAGVWFRAKVDLYKLYGNVAFIIDWKTGKVLDDSCQLALSAACVFAKYPEVKKIRSQFAWLAHNATTDEDFTRDDMPGLWRSLWPRIQALEYAHNNTSYPAKPSGLCRSYCPVSSCVHHGVGG